MRPEKIESLGFKPKHTHFQIAEVKLATGNFSWKLLLGQGGFGKVYRGILPGDRKEVAVKVLRHGGDQGDAEFMTELELLSRLRHRNLVKLYGFCCTPHDRILVYEYISRGSLHDHLHGRYAREVGPLCWEKRIKLATGAARGMKFLHSQRPQILHRDIKAANILITHNFTAKVADFGCAKLIGGCSERQGVDGRIVEYVNIGMGTVGLIAPEMLMAGEISSATDVFSFGVVLLELLTGKEPMDKSNLQNSRSLVAWALPLLRYENWAALFDPALVGALSGTKFIPQPDCTLVKVARLAARCIDFDPRLRPSFCQIYDELSIISDAMEEAAPLPPLNLRGRERSRESSVSSSPSVSGYISRSTSFLTGFIQSVRNRLQTRPQEEESSRQEICDPGLPQQGAAGWVGERLKRMMGKRVNPMAELRSSDVYVREMQDLMALIEEDQEKLDWTGPLQMYRKL